MYRLSIKTIKELMGGQDLKPADLGKIIGKSDVSARHKLSGKTRFTDEEICRIATYFKRTPDIFFEHSVANIESQR